jgi:hypothetical protein
MLVSHTSLGILVVTELTRDSPLTSLVYTVN